MSKLTIFTHHDLDALGCMLNIEFYFKGVEKQYFHTNYQNVTESVDQMLKITDSNVLIICDVAMSREKENLRRLYNHFQTVIYIDHHMYPDGFFDDLPNIQLTWDKEKCAAMLVSEVFKIKGQNENLDRLTNIINVYDIWQKNDPLFKLSQYLNEYFWAQETGFGKLGRLCNDIVSNDFKLPKDFVPTVDRIYENIEKTISKYEEQKLIQRAGEITIVFGDDCFNQIMIREMDAGKNFVIGATSYGIIKIRVNQDAPYTEEQINKVRMDIIGDTDYGHLHAFTYKTDGNTDAVMREVKRVVDSLDNHCV